MNLKTTAITSVICITLIMLSCIWKGIDGILLGAGIAAIAGLGGFVAGKSIHP